ncbi:uncharacterized protein [Phyllobates terribilis]|uniref:uncharacterized protein n=1 Tax=Phyllobates terribilis TaxID=111132 RepID=UPI003CCB3CA3
MSSPLHDINCHKPECTCRSPPSYEEITAPPVWSIPQGPSHQQWNYNSLPPTYHIYSNIPSLNAPLPASQHNSIATIDQWSIEAPRPISSNPSACHTTTVFNHQCNTETPASTYDNISTQARRAEGDHSLNLENTTTQRTLSVIAKRFQKGSKVLGTLMILAACTQIGVGVALVFNQYDSDSKSLSYGIPFWTSAFYIITESLLLAAKGKNISCLVKTSICSNIITWIFCSTAIAFSVLDLEEIKCYHAFCYTYSGASTLYHCLIAMNVLILLLSLVAALVGIYTLTSHSKKDPQQSTVLSTVSPSAPPLEAAQQHV